MHTSCNNQFLFLNLQETLDLLPAGIVDVETRSIQVKGRGEMLVFSLIPSPVFLLPLNWLIF